MTAVAMTPDERADYIAERTRAECHAQGLPEHLEDPAAIERLVELLRPDAAVDTPLTPPARVDGVSPGAPSRRGSGVVVKGKRGSSRAAGAAPPSR